MIQGRTEFSQGLIFLASLKELPLQDSHILFWGSTSMSLHQTFANGFHDLDPYIFSFLGQSLNVPSKIRTYCAYFDVLFLFVGIRCD